MKPALTPYHRAMSDPFIRGYLNCALWSSNDESTPEGGEPFDRNYDISDFAEDALKQAVSECAAFQSAHAELLSDYYDTCSSGDGDPIATAGFDFWLTRNGHGAGFWDRDGLTKRTADALTEASKSAGERNPYLGDDGQIYFA